MGLALGGNQIEGAAAIFIVASGRLITLITAGRSELGLSPRGVRHSCDRNPLWFPCLVFFSGVFFMRSPAFPCITDRN